MAELIERLRSKLQQGPVLLSLVLLLICAVTALTLTLAKPEAQTEPPPSESVPPSSSASLEPSPAVSKSVQPALLVTAEQISRLSYTDSILGDLAWELSEDELLELNRTLVRFDIVSAEEICHFLAQATVETGAGLELTEAGDEAYFRRCGYSVGTRGAGYLHLTHDYGQMAFATWMMKRYVPALQDIRYVNPSSNGAADVAAAYYAALQTAANLGVNVSRYSRIVYDPNSTLTTGADYIAEQFAWESAGYYWLVTGIGDALSAGSGLGPDAVSQLVGGTNWQSRREAYAAFYPVLVGEE